MTPTPDATKEAVAALGLNETRAMDLVAAGKTQEADRLKRAVEGAASDLMMAEGYLVKGEVAEAHQWLVKARWVLAEAVGR